MSGDPHHPAGGDGSERSTAMVRLVDDYLPVLFAYGYRLTGSVEDAEELTQQTFLIAQEKIGQLREASKVQPWLLKVLRNCFLKNVRKRRPVIASEVEIDINQWIEQATGESEWDTEQLQQALEELPDEFRVVVLMFYFEQLSYREIADRLQLPLGTVMSRLSRAKRPFARKTGTVRALSETWIPSRRLTGATVLIAGWGRNSVPGEAAGNEGFGYERS